MNDSPLIPDHHDRTKSYSNNYHNIIARSTSAPPPTSRKTQSRRLEDPSRHHPPYVSDSGGREGTGSASTSGDEPIDPQLDYSHRKLYREAEDILKGSTWHPSTFYHHALPSPDFIITVQTFKPHEHFEGGGGWEPLQWQVQAGLY